MIEYFARNRVAANLLMGAICILGAITAFNKLTLEVFPSVEADYISVRMSYPGATPTEAEEAIGVRMEEAIQDLEGIDRMYTTATEGSVRMTVEVLKGYDPRELLNDVKNRIDSISTFPEDAEKPIIELPSRIDRVLNIVLSGPMSEKDLKSLGERIRDEITNLPSVTQVGLRGARPYEISVEVSESTLQAYELTFADISNAIRRSSVDLSAGRIRTASGDVLIRTDSRAYVQEDFDEIVVRTHPDGSRLTLADLCVVRDGFNENVMYSEFNGHRAIMVDVFRVGDQDVIEIATIVKDYIERSAASLPEGVSLTVWDDMSKTISDRLSTLSSSLMWGGLLVFLILALFLRFSVAAFVAIGVPVSFLGGLALMPIFGISLNLLSTFAFIMVLGIVVDDAIVTGENIFRHMRKGGDPTEAAIKGTHEVSVPVTFGVLTTMIAFIPLMMIPGRRGAFFSVIAVVIIVVLGFSLVQSKLVLPAHMSYLTHLGERRKKHGFIIRTQRKIADGLEWFIHVVYRKMLHGAIKNRYSVTSVFVVIFVLMLAVIFTGRMQFFFFPRIEGDTVTVKLNMPVGTPVEITEGYVRQINGAAVSVKKELNEQYGDTTALNILMTVGGQPFGDRRGGGSSGQSHQGEVMLELESSETRHPEVSAPNVSNMWRDKVGIIPGGEISYIFSRSGVGAPIDVQLSGPDFDQLDELAALIKVQLETYPGVVDIADSFESGKDELKLKLKPAATNLGLTPEDLARQVRRAFYGQQAQRFQRGRDDIRVMVRYPYEERRSLDNLENMRIRTPNGQQVPFAEVADVEMGKSLPSIRRVDRNRILSITADIEEGVGDVEVVKADLVENYLPELLLTHPEVSFSLEGEAREQRESFESLQYSVIMVLFAIYGMLAIVFRSYIQPLIVMLIIPFSVIGAIGFHLIRGDMLSIMSVFGMLALMGVVVNDSLVLVDYINRKRKLDNFSLLRAISYAGDARFRPIFLTSLTTIGGLTPLLLEKSKQAQFLMPMAVSLAGGIAFATFLTLFLVPMVYLIFEDIGRGIRKAYAWWIS